MNDEIENKIDSHSLWLYSEGMEGERAVFSGADLRWANLRSANLNETDLQDANLEGANLEKADLRDASIKGANFTGTVLEKKKIAPVSVSSSPSFGEELSKLLAKHGMKLVGVTVLPK